MTIDAPIRTRRRGFGTVEIAVSSILLVAAMVLVAQLAIGVAGERLATGRRQRAVQEAANVMERLTSRPWDELTPALAGSIALTPDTLAFLRGGSVAVAIAPELRDPSAKKIVVEVRWRDRSGGQAAPARLVAWVYRRGGNTP
jgi:hypothetical protein